MLSDFRVPQVWKAGVMLKSFSGSESVRSLIETVIDGGYCIGCGACTFVEGSPFMIAMNDLGQYEARVATELGPEIHLPYDVRAVCPFADGNPDEDSLARLFGLNRGSYTDGVGYALASFAGYVREGDFRRRGSSGGLATWLLCTLLERGWVDAVIHVRETSSVDGNPNAPLFTMQVSRSVAEVRAGAKSRYYPVEMSRVLKEVRGHAGRYAIVGVPCFVKAVRLLALQEPVIRERIVYCVSLVCGHLKSDRFARMLAWEAGIHPTDLRTIDFRRKLPDRPADRYAIELTTRSGNTKIVPIEELEGYNWGYGFFKYQACDYCDDVLGETADVTIGDAWLPGYVVDPGGTNIVVVRNDRILQLLTEAKNDGRLHLESISHVDVVASQDAGIRHRRHGLAYRLYLKKQEGKWAPRKRVVPAEYHLTSREKKIQELRIALRVESHRAYARAVESGNWSTFTQTMRPLITRYQRLYRLAFWRRLAQKIRRIVLESGARIGRRR